MTCVNCENSYQENDLFCAKCGNRLLQERVTTKSLFYEFTAKFLSVDSKFFATVRDMTMRPEKVIKAYIQNNRVKYLSPINFMIIAGLFGGFYTYLLNNGYLGEFDYSVFSIDSGNEAAMLDQEAYTKEMNTTIQKYYSLVLFATIPFLALISRLVFHNYKQYNIAEHSVIYAYTYSQFLILSYISIPFNYIFDQFLVYYTFLSFFIMIGFHAYVLKRVFSIGWGKMVLKTLFFMAILVAIMIVFTIIATIITFIVMANAN